MTNASRIGLGCMRLSTERGRDDARGRAVIAAALDAGVTLLDTADAYCWDETERGHNERLIARALREWSGDRSRVLVATKGGMTRPGGRWETDGRAKHLAAACEASCRALDVNRIGLYQLHAPDSRTSLATSVRALATLKRTGLVDAIGLCNVTVGQIEDARRITEIDAIQVELSLWHDDALLNGLVEYCANHRLMLLAHRPLGGASRRPRIAKDPTLAEVAARHAASPSEIALAWLIDLGDGIVPIPGATRVDTAQSSAHVPRIGLTDADRADLDRQFTASSAFRHRARGPRPAPSRTDGEVVLVMGLPGAGKSTYAESLVAQGYQRLNRDETGGTLRDLLPALDEALASGPSRIVLDNTYVSRASRARVIHAASARGVPVRCVSLETSLEDAQVNAVSRLVSKYGRLPGDTDLESLRKRDVSAFPPMVQFRYQRELEPPDVSEGFSRVDIVPFGRRRDPSFTNRALIVWCDDVLVRSRSGGARALTPDDVEVVGARGAVLRRYQDEGWRVLGLSWRPEIADGTQTPADSDAVSARAAALLGVDIAIDCCPHAAGPPRCWCRKPLPGLGVLLVHRYRLDPAQCLYVGAGAQDPGYARRLGFHYREAEEFFAR